MTNEHNVAQRAKYYHALMTNHMLTAGENYVIFLCPFNPLAIEQQRAVGHYRMISEEGDYLNDGTHTLILNASGD